MDMKELEKAFKELSDKMDKMIEKQTDMEVELAKFRAILTGNGVQKGAIARVHERIDNTEGKIKQLEARLWWMAGLFITALLGVVIKFHFFKL